MDAEVGALLEAVGGSGPGGTRKVLVRVVDQAAVDEERGAVEGRGLAVWIDVVSVVRALGRGGTLAGGRGRGRRAS